MKNKLFHLYLIAACAMITSCGTNVVVDEYHDISSGTWDVDSLASFEFMIEDTTVDYSVHYNVRYAAQYPYYNLYVTYYLEDSAGNSLQSELQNLLLFDKKSGEPLGTGMGDLFDREISIFDDHKFSTIGRHKFKVKQFMRMEELPGITSFGLKIKKVEKD